VSEGVQLVVFISDESHQDLIFLRHALTKQCEEYMTEGTTAAPPVSRVEMKHIASYIEECMK